MAELESVIEKRLIDKLCSGESQWTYRGDIKTEDDLWKNFKYILEQNNKAKLNDIPLSDSEFAKIKNDLSHASLYDVIVLPEPVVCHINPDCPCFDASLIASIA